MGSQLFLSVLVQDTYQAYELQNQATVYEVLHGKLRVFYFHIPRLGLANLAYCLHLSLDCPYANFRVNLRPVSVRACIFLFSLSLTFYRLQRRPLPACPCTDQSAFILLHHVLRRPYKAKLLKSHGARSCLPHLNSTFLTKIPLSYFFSYFFRC